jgi:DNA-binding response OmpR family regulator
MENHFTIVLTDDDSDETLFFTEAIQEINRNIYLRSFPDGEKLLSWLETTDELPDVIFLDINMPLLNGFEALQELRKVERNRNIPVIVYSTSSNHTDVTKAYDYGANLYLCKVVAMKDLPGHLSKIINAIEGKNPGLLKELAVTAF